MIKQKQARIGFLGILLLCFIQALILTFYKNSTDSGDHLVLEEYLDQAKNCHRTVTEPDATNPRYDITRARPVLLKNATLWDGEETHFEVDILLQNGQIGKVGRNLHFDGDFIQLKGHFVSPGLVDMHSHVGMDSWPAFAGNSDTNEFSQPLTPQVRSLDGFNPWDSGIKIVNSGGVTTSLILPGSSNLMGGEAYAIKTFLPESNRAEDMLINAKLNSTTRKWRWMKFASGENPRNYGKIKEMPESRLGEGWLMRKMFEKARNVKEKQDSWCNREKRLRNLHGSKAHMHIREKYPTDLETETLVALLRGLVLLNVHSYETYDLESLVRLSHEFNFKISAFHHALEAWRVPKLLADEGIGAAIFADHWGYKKEAYDSSVRAAKVLSDHGVKVAFKSDHPVINAQNLIFEAAKGHHYGLDRNLALKAVTSTPAALMGQSHRVGYVKEGFDADVVIWSKDPLEIGAHPVKVFVDGMSTFEHSRYKTILEKDFAGFTLHDAEPTKIQFPNLNDKSLTEITYVNVTGIISDRNSIQNISDKLVISRSPGGRDWNITCLGYCKEVGLTVNLHGGWITPGHFATDTTLGLREIEQEEDATGSGEITNDEAGSIYAKYSLTVGRQVSKELDAAFKAGITTATSWLPSRSFYAGEGVAFRTGARDFSEALLKYAKEEKVQFVNPQYTSVSKQMQKILSKIPTNGGLIKVDNSDRIVILKDRNPFDVFIGGAESWFVAKHLSGRSVILSPARCTPETWFQQKCKVSGSYPSAVSDLLENKVNVGLSTNQDNLLRGLIWEAGWAVSDLALEQSEFEKAKQAVGMITWNVATALGISCDRCRPGTISVGQRPNFVVYNRVPGTLAAKVVFVQDGDLVAVNPSQA